MQVLERQPRAGVRAVADADRRGLQRQLLQMHEHRRGSGGVGVGVDLDDRAFEQPDLLQPFLKVEQHLLAVRLADAKVGQPPNALLVVALQAVDANLADVKQRAAVGDDVQPHGVVQRVDLRTGDAPRRARVALGAQPRDRRVLRVVPRDLAKRHTS